MRNYILIFMSALALVACGKKDKKNSGAAANPGVQTESNVVVKFRYFKGDFLAAPGQPTWSNDMSIVFTTSGFTVTGKHATAGCQRGRDFSEAEATTLFNLVSQLSVMIKQAGEPTSPGEGVEYIEIDLQNGEKRKYHLLNKEVPVGEIYALNPQALHDHLQTLEAGLPTSCSN